MRRRGNGRIEKPGALLLWAATCLVALNLACHSGGPVNPGAERPTDVSGIGGTSGMVPIVDGSGSGATGSGGTGTGEIQRDAGTESGDLQRDGGEMVADAGADCDGIASGAQVACGTETGSCESGLQTCLNGVFGPCIDAVEAKSADTCDPGNDDNCNGVPNEGCPCTNGDVQACSPNVGACSGSVSTCSGGSPGTCSKLPGTEVCNGEDDDCDGSTDEGPCAPDGSSCSSDDECLNGHCTDLRCCDQPCTGECETCNSSGTCVAVSSGQQDSCGSGNACSAAGVCEPKKCEFYTNSNYGSLCTTVAAGGSQSNLGSVGCGDKLSSQRCYGGACARLYVNSSFSGMSWYLCGDVSTYHTAAYGNLGDNASSLKVY